MGELRINWSQLLMRIGDSETSGTETLSLRASGAPPPLVCVKKQIDWCPVSNLASAKRLAPVWRWRGRETADAEVEVESIGGTTG